MLLLAHFYTYVAYYLFFFFQAEDGIRDVAVTGVQTCALPISLFVALPDHHQFHSVGSRWLLCDYLCALPGTFQVKRIHLRQPVARCATSLDREIRVIRDNELRKPS